MLLQPLHARVVGGACKVQPQQVLQCRLLLHYGVVAKVQGNIGAQLPERSDILVCLRHGQVGGRGKDTVVVLPLGWHRGQSHQQGLGTFRQLRGVQYGVIDRDVAGLGFRLLLD